MSSESNLVSGCGGTFFWFFVGRNLGGLAPFFVVAMKVVGPTAEFLRFLAHSQQLQWICQLLGEFNVLKNNAIQAHHGGLSLVARTSNPG